MKQILDFLDTQYIDWTIFLLVIASGFLQARFLCIFTWYKGKDPASLRYDATLKTFVVSAVLCFLYIWLYKYQANGASTTEQKEAIPVLKFFISYALATSFYDLIVRLFKLEAKKRTGIDLDDSDKPKDNG